MKADDPLPVSRILQRYPSASQTRNITSVPPGFSGARIFRVETASATFALRSWPPNALPPERIRGLHSFLAFLHSRGLSFVAVPRPTDAGDTLLEVAGTLWQLEPWLPGAADFHQHPNPARLKSAIRTLARLHLTAREFQSPSQAAEWFQSRRQSPSPAVLERLHRLEQWTPRRIRTVGGAIAADPSDFGQISAQVLRRFESALPQARHELDFLKDRKYDLHPCWRDLWHDHVLFSGDEVTGLIDASSTRVDHPAVDLSRLVGSLIEDNHESWKLVLDEYCRHVYWTDRDTALLRSLDRSSVLLSPMTWITRQYEDGLPVRDDPRVLPRLTTQLRRMERMNSPRSR